MSLAVERESSGSNREVTSLPGQPYSRFGCHGYLKRLVANDHGASISPSVGSPTIEDSEESEDQAGAEELHMPNKFQ